MLAKQEEFKRKEVWKLVWHSEYWYMALRWAFRNKLRRVRDSSFQNDTRLIPQLSEKGKIWRKHTCSLLGLEAFIVLLASASSIGSITLDVKRANLSCFLRSLQETTSRCLKLMIFKSFSYHHKILQCMTTGSTK